MLILRPLWTRQPQDATRVVSTFGGAVPLTALFRGDPFATDGSSVVTVGTVTRSVGEGGKASSHASGATNIQRAIIRGSGIGRGTLGASLLAVFRSTGGGVDKRIVALGSDAGIGGNTVFSIGTGATVANRLRVTVGGSTVNYTFDYDSTNITDNRLHCALVTADRFNAVGTSSVYLDGVVLRDAVANAGALGNVNLYNYIVAGGFRRGGTDTAGAACEVLLAVPFHGAVSSEAGISLTRNPWQLFEPRRIWVPVSAAGGGTAAITAAAGAATASQLTGSSTAESAITSAAGAATASALVGKATSVAAISSATGSATASQLTGSSTARASFGTGAGSATASQLPGTSTARADFGAAAGAATGETLVGSSGSSAITVAACVATAAALVGKSTARADFGVAAGAATASEMAGTTGSYAIDPASGMASAAVLAGSSIAVASFTPAAGVATAATMAGPSSTTVYFWRRTA